MKLFVRLSVLFRLILLFFTASCSLSLSRKEQLENILSAPSIEWREEDLFEKGSWPNVAWWSEYGYSELNLLIATALEKNPSLQAAYERIEFAKSQATIARSNLFPLVYFNANDQLQYLSKNGLYRALNPHIALGNQLIDFSLSFSYEFDFWGKYKNLYVAALGKEKALRAETAQTALIISAAIAQTFFALKTNLIRKNYYEDLWQVRKHYFDLQNKLLKQGLDSKLPPLLSEEAVFEAIQRIYDIEKEISVNKHLINTLAGKGPDELLEITEHLSPLSPKLAIPEAISSELLSRRPDLMAQIWRMDALAKEVGAAKADFWPNINLLGLAGFEAGSWSKIFQWASKTVGIIPGLKLPVYTAGAIEANVEAKKTLFNEAVYEYNDLILKSFQQVSDLLAIAQSVFGEKEKQKQIIANAFTRYNLMRDLQKSGIRSALDSYLLAEELILKKIRDIELLYEQYAVSISLTKALGGGYIAEGSGCDE